MANIANFENLAYFLSKNIRKDKTVVNISIFTTVSVNIIRLLPRYYVI